LSDENILLKVFNFEKMETEGVKLGGNDIIISLGEKNKVQINQREVRRVSEACERVR